MTQDGRPSTINDIRLFAGEQRSYLEGMDEAVAFARRIAWLLNGTGFSLGSFPALYVYFAPSLESGAVRPTDAPALWWFRHIYVGVPADFPDRPDALEIAMRGVVDALLVMQPDQAELIRQAEATVRDHGRNLRFLIKRRETKKLVVDISSSIEAWPKPSQLFISHTDKATGTYCEADPIDLGFYTEGFDLVPGIRLSDAVNLQEKPRPPAMSALIRRR